MILLRYFGDGGLNRNSHTDENGVTHTTRYIADDKGYRVIGRSSAFTGNAAVSSGSSSSAKFSSSFSSSASSKASASAAARAQAAARASAQVKASTSAAAAISVPAISYSGEIINFEQETQRHQQVGDAGNAVEGSYRYLLSLIQINQPIVNE